MSNNHESLVRKILRAIVETPSIVDNLKNDDILLGIGINSLSIVKLAVELENEYDFEIEDDELQMENLSTINKICELIDAKLS